MKTIEEINEIAPYQPCEWQEGYGIWQAGFMEGQKSGADEQKAIDDRECETMVGYAVNECKQVMIDKAREWFKYNAWSFGNCAKGDTSYDWEMAFECFRKAIEE